MPATGSEWAAPAVDPDSMRQAKARAGIPDFSDRVFSGDEIDQLLARATPTFQALILLGVNCALGPADLGRLRWNMLDLQRRRLDFPRCKTGTPRRGFLWKRTVNALLKLRTLKHNRDALEREGEAALVFITREGLPFYREQLVVADLVVDGKTTKKIIGVKIHKPILYTFGRMVRELQLGKGASFYRLRHTFKTAAKKARDNEAVDLMMGHRSGGATGRIYDHEVIRWRRIRRVARVVRRQLWPKIKPMANTPELKPPAAGSGGRDDTSVAA